MAERSFKEQIKALRLGDGETFHGENILAVTKALLECGVSYIGGYQGAPVSHLIDVFADAQDLIDELGIKFESSASEASAAAMLSASINYPMRGAVTWKSTVGTNVASDALANLASSGVKGGALIILGEDYGEGASIMQERTHAFAMKSQIWLLDPRPDQTCVVDSVRQGFELSEASNTPVMLMMRIRACHMHGQFVTKNNIASTHTAGDALANPIRDPSRIILPPATYLQEQEKINERWPAAVKFIRDHKINEKRSGKHDIGIIVQGGLFNATSRALAVLNHGDYFGNSDIPVYVLNCTYPLVPEEFEEFCIDQRAILIIEEGQPEFIEQAANTFLKKAEIKTKIHGKDFLPMAGEYTSGVIRHGLEQFIDRYLKNAVTNVAEYIPLKEISLSNELPARPSGLCTGCPERPLFASMKLLEKELGPSHVSADIGCNSFVTLPPFNMGSTIMGYGLGGASSSALDGSQSKRAISLMGDGGFWHNGLTSGISNAAFNQTDNITIIVDNGYAAATGGQDIPSSKGKTESRNLQQPINKAVKGVGINWVRNIQSYDMKQTMKVLREAITTDYVGPKVIIAEGECQLNRQRRVRPLQQSMKAAGDRVQQEKFGIDENSCTGDHSCIRLSGCPSLSIAPSSDPLRTSPVAQIDQSCVGCGVCGSVAHAATLCPSFYKVTIIHNPNPFETLFTLISQGLVRTLLFLRSWRQKS